MTTPGAVEHWQELVDGRREQMDAAYAGFRRTSADFWAKRADRFRRRAGTGTTDDPLVCRIASLLPATGSVLDIGAGTGRFALPLARLGYRVAALEPSADMVAHLRRDADSAGLTNIHVIEAGWLESEAGVAEADVVLCAHVLYPHREIERWLATLEDHARIAVVLGLMADWGEPPLLRDLWRRFHGAERILQPTAYECHAVLRALGIPANMEIYPAVSGSWYFDSLDDAIELVREHLLVAPDAVGDAVLRTALDEALERDGDKLLLPGARIPAAVWWPRNGPRLLPA
ncbi:MAG: class I SAM-dependent methyltransferase [Dehalococcoidia bacterium]